MDEGSSYVDHQQGSSRRICAICMQLLLMNLHIVQFKDLGWLIGFSPQTGFGFLTRGKRSSSSFTERVESFCKKRKLSTKTFGIFSSGSLPWSQKNPSPGRPLFSASLGKSHTNQSLLRNPRDSETQDVQICVLESRPTLISAGVTENKYFLESFFPEHSTK